MPQYNTSDDVPSLQCSKCKEWKLATTDFFALDRSNKRGFQYRCKKCQSEWWTENTEWAREYKRAYALKHPGKGTEQSRLYRQKNPGRSARAAKKRYAANRQNERKKSRLRYQKNRQNRIKSSRKYATSNPEKIRQVYQRRQARLNQLSNDFSNADEQYAYDYFNYCCAICNRHADDSRIITFDHWIPIADKDCPGTIPANMIPLCNGLDGCNQSKNAKDPIEWLHEKFSPRKAAKILARIEAFFETVRQVEWS